MLSLHRAAGLPAPSRETIFETAKDQEAALPKIHVILDQAVERFNQAGKDVQVDFRKALTDYVRLYAFLAQTARFSDADLEKLYHYAKFLARKLPRVREELPAEIKEQIALESLRVTQTGSGKIDLDRGEGKLPPISPKDEPVTPPMSDQELLSRIIQELNTAYGFPDASEDEIGTMQHLEAKLDADEALKASAQVNTKEHFRLSFDDKTKEKFQELLEENFKLYKRLMDDPKFSQALLDVLFDRFVQRLQTSGEPLGGV